MQFIKFPKLLNLSSFFKEKSSAIAINFQLSHQPATIINLQDIPIHLSWNSWSQDSVYIVFNIDSETLKTIQYLLEIKETDYKINFTLQIYRRFSQFFQSIIFEGLSFKTCYFFSSSQSLYIAETYIAIDGDCLQKVDKKSLEEPELYAALTIHYWLVKQFLNGLRDKLKEIINFLYKIIDVGILGSGIISALQEISNNFVLEIVQIAILIIICVLSRKIIRKAILELITNSRQSLWKIILSPILKISLMIILGIIIFSIIQYYLSS